MNYFYYFSFYFNPTHIIKYNYIFYYEHVIIIYSIIKNTINITI